MYRFRGIRCLHLRRSLDMIDKIFQSITLILWYISVCELPVHSRKMAEQIETPVSRRLSSVKNILIVLSGKGGVGKSSSSVQLALSLLNTSPTARVGLLDLDLTGPSLPRMVGLDLPGASVHQSSAGWVPVYVDQGRRLGVMSIGFLLKDRGDSVVWRGPKKDGMIRQFLSEVRWGELDYLVIDTPPGKPSFLNQYSEKLISRNIRRTHFPHDPSTPPL